MAGPELMKRNISLKDEKKVLKNMLQKLQKNLPKKLARSIQQITKDPEKQSKMLTEFREALTLSSFEMTKIINNPKLTIEKKEEFVRKEIESLGNKTFEIALKHSDPTNIWEVYGPPAVGGIGMALTGIKAYLAGAAVVMGSAAIGAVGSLGCAIALECMYKKIDKKTAKIHASIFTSNVAKELGIKISEFTPDVVPKKR